MRFRSVSFLEKFGVLAGLNLKVMDDVILMIRARAINNKKRAYMFKKKEEIKNEGIFYLANKNYDESLSPRAKNLNKLNI